MRGSGLRPFALAARSPLRPLRASDRCLAFSQLL